AVAAPAATPNHGTTPPIEGTCMREVDKSRHLTFWTGYTKEKARCPVCDELVYGCSTSRKLHYVRNHYDVYYSS
ncbi:hypothetical protein PMAYCL1PPCAC_14463, partial [Pristionchus mayeri]